MSTANLKILVISFYFPPYNKVGGRRWAKHFKYLVKNNIQTFVLAGNYDGVSSWDKDIEDLKENIFRVENNINEKPFYQKKLPSGFFEKIKWKVSYYTWNIKKTKLRGNYNDPSYNNFSNYLDKAKEIIEQKSINTVVISVGPFNYSSILPVLKKQFPGIKYVIDYRDYWEDSLAGLTAQQVNFEHALEQEVISAADLILAPNSEMEKFYASKFNKKSYCLPHCFDEEDLLMGLTDNYTAQHSLNLIYGGAFYTNIHDNIEVIKNFINECSKANDVNAGFYVSVKGYEKELEHPKIKRYDFIDTKLFFNKVKHSDLVILILPDNRVNAMSSKFFELVALRKPILYFGKEGEVSKFIIENRLGFHITSNNMAGQVKIITSNKVERTIPDLNYDISKHSFQYQTKKLINQLQILCQNQG